MIDLVGPILNHTTVPTPVLDDSEPQGYRIEERLQLIQALASNERQQYTVEFRLGDDSQAPSTELLNTWLESGELVQTFCTGLAARPFVHAKDKTYQRRGRQVQVGDQTAELDAFVVFAGASMAPLEAGSPLEAQVKQARAAYKRSQRLYRDQRNAARIAQIEAQMGERVKAMQERRAETAKAQAAAPAAQPPGEPGGRGETSTNGRRR
jgi:hypothetical protein